MAYFISDLAKLVIFSPVCSRVDRHDSIREKGDRQIKYSERLITLSLNISDRKAVLAFRREAWEICVSPISRETARIQVVPCSMIIFRQRPTDSLRGNAKLDSI